MMRRHLPSGPIDLPPGANTLPLIVTLCASVPCIVAARQIPIAPEPLGSGARALGQSAFIAVADDATAASWNPAGLIQLERPEASLVGIWRAISNDLSLVGGAALFEGEAWSEAEAFLSGMDQDVEGGNRWIA